MYFRRANFGEYIDSGCIQHTKTPETFEVSGFYYGGEGVSIPMIKEFTGLMKMKSNLETCKDFIQRTIVIYCISLFTYSPRSSI